MNGVKTSVPECVLGGVTSSTLPDEVEVFPVLVVRVGTGAVGCAGGVGRVGGTSTLEDWSRSSAVTAAT